MVSFLIDSYPSLASTRNKRQQSALHVCLESNALDAYQTLIRCHSPDLDIRSPDQFGHIPIDIWKHVMEEKRELGCSGFPHETKKPLVLVTHPFDEHRTCACPPRRTVGVFAGCEAGRAAAGAGTALQRARLRGLRGQFAVSEGSRDHGGDDGAGAHQRVAARA